MATTKKTTDNIQESYDKSLAAQLAALQNKYSQNVSAIDSQMAKLPEQYQGIKNNAAVTRAQDKQSFNEFAAGTGLNTGASGQAELARSNVYQQALTSADRGLADQLSAFNLQKNNLAADYSTNVATARAQTEAQKMSALAQQMNTDRSFEANQQQQERANYAANVGAYSNDFLSEISRLKGDGDTSNDWQIPYLQNAMNDQAAQLESAKAKAEQQAFENQMAQKSYELDVYKAQKSGSSSGSGSTTPRYGGLTASEINNMWDSGLLSEEAALKLLGINGAGTQTQQTVQNPDRKGIEQLSPTALKIAGNFASMQGSPRDRVVAIEAALRAGSITEQDADILLKAIGY